MKWNFIVYCKCIEFVIEWPFGVTICKLVAYVEAVAISASVNSLVVISLDRCLTINTAFGSTLGKRTLFIWLTIVWLFPILSMSPWLVVFAVKPQEPGKRLMVIRLYFIIE